jgi:hypothetical protein
VYGEEKIKNKKMFILKKMYWLGFVTRGWSVCKGYVGTVVWGGR